MSDAPRYWSDESGKLVGSTLDEVLARFAADQPELHGTKLIIEVDVADADPQVIDADGPARLLVDMYTVMSPWMASRDAPATPWGKITFISAKWS